MQAYLTAQEREGEVHIEIHSHQPRYLNLANRPRSYKRGNY